MCATLELECGTAVVVQRCIPTSIKWNKLSRDVIQERYTQKLEVYARSVIAENDFEVIDKSKIDLTLEDTVAHMLEVIKDLPTMKYHPNIKPYWNGKLTHLKKCKVASYRRWVPKGRPSPEDYVEWLDYKRDKRAFRREIKHVQKEYERKEIEVLLRTAECDKNRFWRMLKKSRKTTTCNSDAVKNKDGKVVHDLNEVVKVWKSHFETLSTEKHLPRYDKSHYEIVTAQVK